MLGTYEKIYMKQLQLLISEYVDYKGLPEWNYKGIEVLFLDDWTNVDKSIPVLCYADLLYPNVRNWLNNAQPAIYSGRGYVGNHLYKHRLFHRASVNGWANTKLLNIPHSRWHMMNLPKHPWKVKEVNNILIAPSKMTSEHWTLKANWVWAEETAKKFPGANIKIRYKVGKQGRRYETLWDDLDWADLVVSQSSAITSEAFWYGKKVISTQPCITWAAGDQSFEDWKNPNEPELRDIWHEHLAWSQFTTNEWLAGEALELIEKYVGPITEYKSGHVYNFSN
jgi:hypothetical protein